MHIKFETEIPMQTGITLQIRNIEIHVDPFINQ